MAPLLLILLLAGDPLVEISPQADAAVEPQPPAPEPPVPEAAPPATQEPKPPEPPPDKVPPVGPPPAHTGIQATLKAIPGDFGHLPTGNNIGILGVGGVLALAAHSVDDDVNRRLKGSKTFFGPGRVIGNGAVLIGVTLGTYVRYDYAREKREALELWADRLAAIVGGSAAKVVSLR